MYLCSSFFHIAQVNYSPYVNISQLYFYYQFSPFDVNIFTFHDVIYFYCFSTLNISNLFKHGLPLYFSCPIIFLVPLYFHFSYSFLWSPVLVPLLICNASIHNFYQETSHQKTLSQNVREMTRRSDDMYDQKFCVSETAIKTPVHSVSPGTHSKQSNHSPSINVAYKSRDSSTGGKLPPYGPRRLVKPGSLFQGEFETHKSKFSVSSQQLKNYQAICNLATYQYSRSVLFLFSLICHLFIFYHFQYFFVPVPTAYY